MSRCIGRQSPNPPDELTAIQDQLGLKPVSELMPKEFLVVDHIELPRQIRIAGGKKSVKHTPTTFQCASIARINHAESLEGEYFLFPNGEFTTPTAHTYLEALTVSY
jgi:hypothetical protein